MTLGGIRCYLTTLSRRLTDVEAARQFKATPAQVAEKLAAARRILFDTRRRRPRPHLDDKIVTAWNGLMISAFARAHQALGDAPYRAAATRAARFIQSELYDRERGVLRRSYREGPAAIDGFAADYAFLIQGLLDLYEAGFDVEWLDWADRLQTKQDELFWDDKGGGYFASTRKDASVLLRLKETYDGAEPSENSVAIRNLVRLAFMLDQPARREKALRALRAFAGELERAPIALPQMLVALDAARGKPAQIVIAGRPDAEDTRALLAIVRAHAKPTSVVLLADGGAGQRFLGSRVSFYESVFPIDGRATVYVCENFACQLPTSDPMQLRALLRKADDAPGGTSPSSANATTTKPAAEPRIP